MLHYLKILRVSNKILFSIALLIICSLQLSAATIYVNVNASGSNNGTSWFNAYTNLQTAISNSSSGDQIWVAKGTYKPTTGTSRAAHFSMKDGVGIYGGFNGNESSLNQRNITVNLTILSGDIGTVGSKLDNSIYLIVNDNNGLTNTAILDGFTLRDTYYNASLDPFFSSAAGVFNYHVTPTIRNCTFRDLLFENGNGFKTYIFNKDNLSSSALATKVVFDHCYFLGNQMDGNFEICDAIVSQLNAEITDCVFNNFADETNSSVRTDGIFLGHIPNEVRPDLYYLIKNCSFFNTSVRFSSYDPVMHVNIEECTMFSFAKWLWAGVIGQIVTSASEPCCTTHDIEIINTTVHIPCHTNNVMLNAVNTLNYSNSNLDANNGTCSNCLGNDEPHLKLSNGELEFFASSPGINLGANGGVSSVDLGDDPRIFSGTVDMGAYELQSGTVAQISPVTSVSGNAGSGPTVQVSASGGTGNLANLVWYNTMGQVVGTGNPVSLPVSSSIEYGFYVRYENGNQASDFHCFTTEYCASPVQPTLSPTSATVCTGGSTNVSANGSGSGVTYHWYSGSCGGTSIGTGTSMNLGPGTYYVRAYDASKPVCPWSSCATVTINSASSPTTPLLNASTTTVCNGSTTTVTASGSGSGVTYYWYSNSCGNGSLGTGTTKNLGPGTYYVRAVKLSNPGACQQSSCATITINGVSAPSSPSLSPTSAIVCAGTTTTITASGASSANDYQWFSGSCGGTSLGTGSTKTLGPGTYYIRIYDSSKPPGCQYSTCTSITIGSVTAPNAPTINPNPTTVCAGSTTTVTVSGSGTGAVYHWYSGSCGGTSLGTGTSKTLGVGIYYVRAIKSSNPTGCQWSVCTTVNINSVTAPSKPNLNPTQDSICIGSTTTINVTSPVTGLTYYWYTGSCGGTLIGTGSSQNYGPGTYYVQAQNLSNPLGCQWSTCETVTIYGIANPTSPTLSSLDDTICAGSTTTISASGSGNGVTYNWYSSSCNGSLIGTGNTLTVGPGVYYAMAYDSNFPSGCQWSTCDSITIDSFIKPLDPLLNFSNDTVCIGDSTTVSVTNGTAGNIYYWYTGSCGGNIIGTGTIQTLPAGIYYVQAYNSNNPNGCQWSGCTIVNIENYTSPQSPQGIATYTICEGETVTMTITSISGISYDWYDNPQGNAPILATGNSYVVTPTVSTTYYVFSTLGSCRNDTMLPILVNVNQLPADPVGNLSYDICEGTSITLYANPTAGDTVIWSYDSTFASQIGLGDSIVVSPVNDTIIYAVSYNGICFSGNFLSIHLELHDNPTATSTVYNPLCLSGSDGTIEVLAASPNLPLIVNWSNGAIGDSIGGLVPGVYYYTVTDAIGCLYNDSSLVAPADSINPVIGGNTTICEGDSTLLVVLSNKGVDFNWGNGIKGDSIVFSPINDTTVIVLVTDANKCFELDSIAINVNPKPDAKIYGLDSICSNEEAVFYVLKNSLNSYIWSTGSPYDTTIIPGISTINGLTVTVTDQNGCRAIETRSPVFLEQFTSPTAGIDTIGNIYGQNYQFLDNSSPSVNSWIWDFGDGQYSQSKNPYHIYENPGDFNVWLHVTNEYGCEDSTSIEIEVEEYLIIPNVFTPNGDGSNDVFEIPNVGMVEFELTIYNRWGTLLYNTKSTKVRWDGRTHSGRMVSEDTYYYELKAVGSKDYSTTGHIMVLF